MCEKHALIIALHLQFWYRKLTRILVKKSGKVWEEKNAAAARRCCVSG